MYHLIFNFFHIGDQICTTAIPENIFNVTGKKCAITNPKIWAFKYNPYVEFITEEEAKTFPKISLIPDCRITAQTEQYENVMKCNIANSQTEYMCVNLNFNDIRLRHPRLYIYEDSRIKSNKVVVHTTGSDRTRDGEQAIRFSSGEDSVRIMSDEVLDSIKKNYADYDIVQVGGKDDKPLGGSSVNLSGKLDLWETAKEISEAAVFIGVNSGPMHIANCYPRVNKRIVLQEFPLETLMTFRPSDTRNWLFSWIDPSGVYFNKYNQDVAYTFSHTKI